MSSSRSSAIPEPHLSFRHADLKIVWANELITHLRSEIREFVQAKPYEIILVPEPQGGGYVLGARITKPIPLPIPCLTGDICHNLRSSLDFCFMGLKRSLDPQAKRMGNVPFADNRKGVESIIRNVFCAIADNQMVARIVELFGDRIETHNDFAQGGNRRLCALNDLSNWQKHNLLIPAFSVTQLAEDAVLESDDGSRVVLGGVRIGGSAVGVSGNVCLHQTGDPSVEVTIEGKYLSGRREVIAQLVEFSEAAAEALKVCCCAFPSSHNPSFA